MTDKQVKTLSNEIINLTFLVVENNEALKKSIMEILAGAGVKNSGAVSNGAEAWQVWKRKKGLGVIISAWNLPEMPGLEIVKRIRADKMAKFQPAFIIIAAEDTPDAVEKAVADGADCFLPKPFKAETLIPMIIEGIEHRKQVSGVDSFSQRALESMILESKLKGELIFERYTTEVECDELSAKKCVIRVENNYGLGTVLNLRLALQKPGVADFYQPIKGTVTKIERIPKEYGWFRLHLQFNRPTKAHHGVMELLSSSKSSASK